MYHIKWLRVKLGLNALKKSLVVVGAVHYCTRCKERSSRIEKHCLEERVVKQKTECAHFTRLCEREQLVKRVYEWERL